MKQGIALSNNLFVEQYYIHVTLLLQPSVNLLISDYAQIKHNARQAPTMLHSTAYLHTTTPVLKRPRAVCQVS